MSDTTVQYALISMLAVVVVVVVARFERFCLQQLADTPDTDLLYFTRDAWRVLIVFFIPLGGMLFMLRGRA